MTNLVPEWNKDKDCYYWHECVHDTLCRSKHHPDKMVKNNCDWNNRLYKSCDTNNKDHILIMHCQGYCKISNEARDESWSESHDEYRQKMVQRLSVD